jgi:hypothetical protein
MKAVTYCAILSAVLASGLLAQTQEPPDATPLLQHIQISAKVAEKLLLH